jgi:hypothetical protein
MRSTVAPRHRCRSTIIISMRICPLDTERGISPYSLQGFPQRRGNPTYIFLIVHFLINAHLPIFTDEKSHLHRDDVLSIFLCAALK